jgi:factor associated with neutral sphingomyelinase activation
MFSGIQETWNNVNIGGGDVKELVPEFYEGDGEFLTNALRR